jgi:hypothetical protein
MDKITLGELFDILERADFDRGELEIFDIAYKIATRQRFNHSDGALIVTYIIFINQFRIKFLSDLWIWACAEVKIIDLDQFPRKTIFYGVWSEETINTTLKSIIGVSPVKSARN